jgi:hypothetical protein
MKKHINRTKAIMLLALTLACLIGTQLMAIQGNLFLVAELCVDNNVVSNVIAGVGLASSVGIDVAAAVLCVNPWLGIGLAAAYGA